MTGFIKTSLENISYRISDSRRKVDLLSLHGAGPSGKERIQYVIDEAEAHGLNCLTFDFSGHGLSTGELRDSSLKKRVYEAKKVLTNFDRNESLILIGTSMGGHIAIELLEHIPVHELILFCPAAYSRAAFDLPFNNQFTTEIRRHKSYIDSKVFSILENYRKKMLLFVGKDDKIIPAEVIDRYWSSSINCEFRKFVQLEECPHAIHGHATKNYAIKTQILAEIISLIS